MKILFNAANVRFGGGVTVAKNIIKSILTQSDYKYIHLLIPSNAGYDFTEDKQVTITYIPDKFHSNYFFKTVYIRKYFSDFVEKINPDIVFSLGNVAFPCNRPHLLLIQNAYLFYPESELWKRLPFKFKMYIKLANLQTKTYLKNADFYLLQTTVMQKRLQHLFHVPESKTGVLPNVVSYQSVHIDKNHPVLPKEKDTQIKLLFLSKYYAHKNFDILLPLAELIKKQNKKISISLTVSPDEHPDLGALHHKIKESGYDEIITFIGNVDPAEIDKVFTEHDGTFLPSLLESFSGTYIESMFYGRPVFTSGMDFAEVVCGEAGIYFDPLNASEILQQIVTYFKNPILLQKKIQAGYQKILQLPRWEDLAAAINQAIDKMQTHLDN